MEGDCSGRICQFGMSHVDSPLGDLDKSGSITGPSNIVGVNGQLYPFGITEQFPNVVDSDDTIISNSAHLYAECSNRGVCGRKTGECSCFEGYEGAACQKKSCPSFENIMCHGHGVCESAGYFANQDDENIYELWDKEATQGCFCDAGYYGSSCEFKKCSVGFDPIYDYDVENSHRYSNWSFSILSLSPTIQGNYSLIFYDSFGEDWRTEPIDYGASCFDVTKALEALPNNVVPSGSTRCLKWDDYSSMTLLDEPGLRIPNYYFGIKYTLAFPLNPGILKQITIDKYLDGTRATLFTKENTSSLTINIYPNGFHGEHFDYFEKCIGVDVVIMAGAGTYNYLSGLTPLEFRLLSQCLGDVDGLSMTKSASGKVEGQIYNWDYGSVFNPHIIKLVDKTSSPVTDLCLGNTSSTRKGNNNVFCSFEHPPGFFAAVFYNNATSRFALLNKPGGDYSSTTLFSVFTTTGVVQLVSDQVRIYTNPTEQYSKTVFIENSTSTYSSYLGNIDCESNLPNENGALDCVEKGDRIFFLDPSLSAKSFATNPKYFNLYTVNKIYTAPTEISQNTLSRLRIKLDMSINSEWLKAGTSLIRPYIFKPPVNDRGQGGFEYVSECSNRGLCSRTYGDCSCFSGFEGGSCSLQTNLLST